MHAAAAVAKLFAASLPLQMSHRSKTKHTRRKRRVSWCVVPVAASDGLWLMG